MPVVVGQTLWQFAYNFQLGETAPGGGNTICKSGGIIWIVAPNTSEVIRCWDLRNDAVTTATNCTTATGWFVPTCGQLQNPGYCCRTYWDSYSSNYYWSSTADGSGKAWVVSLSSGGANSFFTGACTYRVRAFRCVTY